MSNNGLIHDPGGTAAAGSPRAERGCDNCLALAVETSSLTGSAALAIGQRIIASRRLSGPLRHNAELFEAVFGLLDAAGRAPSRIQHVYISAGPGSFTGLRIAVTMAKMMSLACSARIVAVDSLDVVAANVIGADRFSDAASRIAVLVDARRGYFYAAVYEKRGASTSHEKNAAEGTVLPSAGWGKTAGNLVVTRDEFVGKFVRAKAPLWLLGEALIRNKNSFTTEGAKFLDRRLWEPSAEKVHLLGRRKAMAGLFVDPASLQPIYMCRPPRALGPQSR